MEAKMKTFIRVIREDAGMTRAKLSEQSGVPIATIANWEQGRKAPNDLCRLKQVAKVLHVPIDTLIDWDSVGLEYDE